MASPPCGYGLKRFPTWDAAFDFLMVIAPNRGPLYIGRCGHGRKGFHVYRGTHL